MTEITITHPGQTTGGFKENSLVFGAKTANITDWSIQKKDGTPVSIFYPTTEDGGKKRGGAHHCYPFFGSGKGHFSGAEGRHGFVRDGMELAHMYKDSGVCKTFLRFKEESQKAKHPYDVSIGYGLTENTLNCSFEGLCR